MGPNLNPQRGLANSREPKNLFDFFDFAVIYISFGYWLNQAARRFFGRLPPLYEPVTSLKQAQNMFL
jgi:hypothetical protein